MDDEDVIFEGSPLYEHLVDAGIDDFNCEKKNAVDNPEENGDDDSDKAKNGSQLDKVGWWTNLKCSLYSYVYDESWHKQVKSLHKRSCNHIINASIKKQVLYEDDATYVESFASSLSAKAPQLTPSFSDSLYGQMFLQVAVLCVTIGYGLLRMFYAKSGPSSPALGPQKSPSPTAQHPQPGVCCSALIYGLDFLSLAVTVAALLPATVKFSSVGRLVGRLDSFSARFDGLVAGLESLRKTSAKAILFVQEAEVIRRGYTLVTVPVSRLELGLNACDRRECLDLRRSVFHRNGRVLLAIRIASISLLKLFPSNVELKGVKQCLARRPLRDFSDYLEVVKDRHRGSPSGEYDGDDDDGEVFKLTDGYSLSSLKFLTELTGVHASELVRLLSLLSLIRTDELSTTGSSSNDNNKAQGFSDLSSIVSDLVLATDRNLAPLEQCLTMAQTVRNKLAEGNEGKDDKRRRRGGRTDGRSAGRAAMTGVHVTLHSLKLHLESALRRVQSHDANLEAFLDDDNSTDDEEDDDDDVRHRDGEAGDVEERESREDATGVSAKCSKMADEISNEAKQLGKELKAGKECLEELEMIISKLFKKTPKPSDSINESSQSCQKVTEDGVQKDVHLIVAGTEPVVEDEFFEGVSGKDKDSKPLENDEESENLRTSRKDAARVISELRSVISVRARDMEERERKAFLRKNPGPDGDVHDRLRPTSNGHPEGSIFRPPSVDDLSDPCTPLDGRTSPQSPGGVEEGFNGARPKESARIVKNRKDRMQYFGERAESSDSDEGNVSSNHRRHHPPPHPKATHLRQRRPPAKISPESNESSCGAASPETGLSRDPESEESNDGTNDGLFGFRRRRCKDDNGDECAFGGGVCNSDFQAPLTMKGLADMAASLSRRINLGDEDLYGNDEVDEEDDDDVVGRDDEEEEEEDEEDEVNDVSESQSDLDSDDIYHVTDDDEGFDGVNVGYDDDDDDEDK